MFNRENPSAHQLAPEVIAATNGPVERPAITIGPLLKRALAERKFQMNHVDDDLLKN
jgi:hypothetical protein